ncbi:MAG: FAD-dependent oxidoreductase, partial [Pseudobutyrivibrio sp.]|nr:FAD-dependent oxidoreductase [Pseudobutyrivibrio sp.]
MIQINQLKVPVGDNDKLNTYVAKKLKIEPKDIKSIRILKQSIDARKKPDILYVYTVDVSCDGEQKLLKKCRNKNVS